jgi:hypothetical protein
VFLPLGGEGTGKEEEGSGGRESEGKREKRACRLFNLSLLTPHPSSPPLLPESHIHTANTVIHYNTHVRCRPPQTTLAGPPRENVGPPHKIMTS